jgi:hypothetical protein
MEIAAMRIGFVVALLFVGVSVRAADEITLFNGKDFSGWTFFLEQKDYNVGGRGKISDFASVKPGGVIQLDPKMHGALMTKKDYLNYKIHIEWRWVDPSFKRNNSGLFLRIRPPFVWDSEHGELPGFYQVQISPSTTGELWVLGAYSETKLKTDPARSYIPFGTLQGNPMMGSDRRHLPTKDAEKPAGEWNSMDVTLDGKNIAVTVNDELVNEGTNLVDLPGRIGLESEFGPVQYRNIRLTKLPD